MNSYLRCVFKMDDGKNRTISLRYPRADITALEVEEFMDTCIDADFLDMTISAIVGAEIVTRTVTPLI
ncbi:MAG: DUF2922 domain-containing protein [Aminivibrio sp.]|jgi:hypothetical protein